VPFGTLALAFRRACSRERLRDFSFRPFLHALLFMAGTAPAVAGQQFVVDDAGVVDSGACQLEGWVGEEEFWILPACSPFPRGEIALGAVRHSAWAGALQGKVLLRDPEVDPDWRWGVVAGLSFRPFSGAYAYLPVTMGAFSEDVVLHVNAGWAYEREAHSDHVHEHHGLLWGLRTDVDLSRMGLPRVALIGELFGLTGEGTEAQAGLRIALREERLFVDLSHGFALRTGDAGLGPQAGISLTPPPFLPRRPRGDGP